MYAIRLLHQVRVVQSTMARNVKIQLSRVVNHSGGESEEVAGDFALSQSIITDKPYHHVTGI